MKKEFLFTEINILISKHKIDEPCSTDHFGVAKLYITFFLARRCSPLQCNIIHMLFIEHKKIRMGRKTLKSISLNHKWHQDFFSLHL